MKTLIKYFFALVVLTSQPALSDDAADLKHLLDGFLAGQSYDDHNEFWAEDLIYTGSGGTRTDKKSILDGMKAAMTAPQATDHAETKTVYSAEDTNIRVYGTTAIITFKLVAKNGTGETLQHYFNTGTFLKRDNKWQAVAWQATKIPKS